MVASLMATELLSDTFIFTVVGCSPPTGVKDAEIHPAETVYVLLSFCPVYLSVS